MRKYIIDNAAEIHMVQCEVSAPDYNRELCAMLAHSRLSGETEDSSDRGMAAFLRMWNGPLELQPDGSCKLQHFCSGCCAGEHEAKCKLADSYLGFMMARQPETPAPGPFEYVCLQSFSISNVSAVVSVSHQLTEDSSLKTENVHFVHWIM